ncbi:hypothetical protein VCM39_07000 [Bacteroides sp. CG01]|uniref:hypothetical protein n=1 Tax=Bacteroides sp. CG01 TaxID=3096000 RepID=UPI002AFE3CE1|nr:hypothetical protein [Bacteroides sp. CG01]
MHKVPASYPYGACSPTVQETCFSVGMRFFGGKQCFFGGKHRRLDSSFAGKKRIFAAINLPDV